MIIKNSMLFNKRNNFQINLYVRYIYCIQMITIFICLHISWLLVLHTLAGMWVHMLEYFNIVGMLECAFIYLLCVHISVSNLEYINGCDVNFLIIYYYKICNMCITCQFIRIEIYNRKELIVVTIKYGTLSMIHQYIKYD